MFMFRIKIDHTDLRFFFFRIFKLKNLGPDENFMVKYDVKIIILNVLKNGRLKTCCRRY